MKKVIAMLTVTLALSSSFANSTSAAHKLADAAVQSFTWDIKQTQRGPMMFLDVPYHRGKSQDIEYVTLTVAKETSKERPAFISLIVPDNIHKGSGVLLSFVKGEGNQVQESVKVPIHSCTKDFCVARIIDGIAVNEETKKNVDVYKNFLEFDRVFITITYEDSGDKSILVPLFSFKEQYRNITSS